MFTNIHKVTLINMIIYYMLFFMCITYSFSISIRYMKLLLVANSKKKKIWGGRAISIVILTTTPLVSGSDAYVHIGGIITVHCEYKVVLVFQKKNIRFLDLFI